MANQTPVSMSSFIAAREEGKTVKELAVQFGISEANCKKIISKLNLPKRAIKPGFVLVDDTVQTPVFEAPQVEATNNIFEQSTL